MAGLLALLPAGRASCCHAASDIQGKRLLVMQKRYELRREKFAQDMNQLAEEVAAQSYFSAAEEIRRRAMPVEAGAYDLDTLPVEIVPGVPLTLPEAERSWRIKQQKLEQDYAADTYRLARDALREGLPSLTYQLVREVAFHDPNHANARSMLGFVREKSAWTTPFLRRMAQDQMVDHPRFGWMPAKHVSRYESGERLVNGQWISAEKEAALRRDFQNAWEIGSEHFLIRTNHSQEKGVELSRQLERFHDFFMKEFTAFFNSRQQMEKLLDVGAKIRWTPEMPRYRVSYYRNQAEFFQALKSQQPDIEIANGLYLPHVRTAYFYFDENSENDPQADQNHAETMYHEVTHQLLGESRPGIVDAGKNSDFWVVEGFACYLESYQPDRPGQELGNPRHLRNFWARQTILVENNYLPMREFTALGQPPAFPLKAETYNQAAAMVHFFLNYNDGEYRDAFIYYLSQVYNPARGTRSRTPNTLEDLTGVRFEMLDQQFLEHLRGFPADPPPGVQVIMERPRP